MGIVSDDIGTANRIVGFYEYSKALEHLDDFIASATDVELEAADRIVKERDQFAVFVNLSRLLQHKPTRLAETTQVPNDDFLRRGLGWVTAVARVEVQAVMASFTAHREPFSVVEPTEFDGDEYNEVLVDGMRTHFWAFQLDPLWKKELAAKVPSSRTLAYLRRLAMLNGFTRTVVRRMGNEFNPAQANELTRWQLDIQNAGRNLREKVQLAIRGSQLQNAHASAKYRNLLQQCQGLCAGMR